MDELLQLQKVKHFLQLQYLSKRHDSSILKLRFVLDPFSFIFLLTGREQYHVVWETLDTEEATYLWHIDKNIDSLKQKLTACSILSVIMEDRLIWTKNLPISAVSSMTMLIQELGL
ncbi:hypothetical protein [Catalinimonas locisalis]|uniref:hypothetical protein n=1 Tax=Catalinimonas locisalis TaxID=3133978 RepID=UPI003101A028